MDCSEKSRPSPVDVKEFFVSNVVHWYAVNKRDFPWRREPTPYEVLISEIMLQRTQAPQVAVVYRKFLQKYTSPESIASADKDKLLEALRPLGLHHRIARMQKMASTLVQKYDGKIPRRRESLLELPGVGPYIANAVLCFGFGEDVPLVDSNVARLYERYFAIHTSKKRRHTDSRLWDFAKSLLPEGDSVRFNRAILDFAALICRLKPLCHKCDLSERCQYVIEEIRTSSWVSSFENAST